MQNKKLQAILFTIFFILALFLVIFGSEQMIEIFSKDQTATKKITESEMIENATYTGVERKNNKLISRFWDKKEEPKNDDNKTTDTEKKDEKPTDKKACPT